MYYFQKILLLGLAILSLVFLQNHSSAQDDIKNVNLMQAVSVIEPFADDNDFDIDPDKSACPCEVRFRKEYPIVWSGYVAATFAGGQDFAIERYRQWEKYPRFYVEGSNGFSIYDYKEVRVYGRMIGSTCAYGTVFSKCVPLVVMDEIVKLK